MTHDSLLRRRVHLLTKVLSFAFRVERAGNPRVPAHISLYLEPIAVSTSLLRGHWPTKTSLTDRFYPIISKATEPMFRLDRRLYLTKYERRLFRLIVGRRIPNPVDIDTYNRMIEVAASILEKENSDDGSLKSEALRVTKVPSDTIGLTILPCPLRPFRGVHCLSHTDWQMIQADLNAEQVEDKHTPDSKK